jgi:hypothetical protein
MVQACVIFYNDGVELFEQCLKYIKGKVDKIVAIDGAFKEFPHSKVQSTDGCLGLARKYADEVITTKKPWADQIEKRNAYLTLKDSKDFYFIIDADEKLDGELPDTSTLEEDAYAFNIHPFSSGSMQTGLAIRLIRNFPDIEYRGRHSFLWHKGKIFNHVSFKESFPVIDTAEIYHYPDLRPKKRQEQDGEYIRSRQEEFFKVPESAKGKDTPFHGLPKNSKYLRMQFLGNHYAGMDGDKNIKMKRGECIILTEKYGRELVRAYGKDQWKIVGEVSLDVN